MVWLTRENGVDKIMVLFQKKMHFTVFIESHVTRIRGRKSGNEIVLFCFLSEFIYNECNFGGIFSHRQVSRVHYTRRKVWQTLPFFSIILCVL